ncbi:MAG: WbuC family cupin fold metalloprotein [Bacteroidales bacterium]|nr:WbuC family cupin fold metalloprotein [Bacteroidales bacterium]
MNRSEFAKILNSIIVPQGTPIEEINSMVRPISEAVFQMMPKSLYRYRACNDRSIDAFEKDIIYAVTADNYNDPYDTLVKCDIEGIKAFLRQVFSVETLAKLKTYMAHGNSMPEEIVHSNPNVQWNQIRDKLLEIEDVSNLEGKIDEILLQVSTSIDILLPIISESAKRFSTYACFCESVDNMLMWSHYADSHRGFALEYDFRQTLSSPIENTILLPVVYSEDRLDVSAYMMWAFLWVHGNRVSNPDTMAHIKVALNKSISWAYEKEWRMINSLPRNPFDQTSTAIEYKPVAIYYGSKMPLDVKMRLHEIANCKGLREYSMAVDYCSPKYEMKVRPFEGFPLLQKDKLTRTLKGVIDKKMMDNLTAQAKASPRLRINLDLRNSPEDKSQRMLNAIEPGTVMPIHRHRSSSETVVCIRGHFEEYFYDDSGALVAVVDMRPGGNVLNVPIGQWHSLKSLESGTILFECKDGPYEPLGEEDVLTALGEEKFQ